MAVPAYSSVYSVAVNFACGGCMSFLLTAKRGDFYPAGWPGVFAHSVQCTVQPSCCGCLLCMLTVWTHKSSEIGPGSPSINLANR